MMVISQFHPVRGGAENQAWALSRALAARGADVAVLTLRQPGSAAEEQIEGVRILRELHPIALGPLWGWSYFRQVIAALRRHRDEYDIVHCHQVYIHSAAAARVKGELKKRLICKVACGGEWGDFLRLRGIRGGERYTRLSLGADRMIALNRDLEGEIAAAGFPTDRIALIPNLVDTDHFQAGAGDGPRNEIVFIGRLHEQKNLALLLEAFALAAKDRPENTLRLVGDGPERQMLEAKAQALGIARRVFFEGQQNDVRPFLHRAALVATATRAEGMSNAILEAMASGVAVVASDAPGNAELLAAGPDSPNGFSTGDHGFIVRTPGTETFAAALSYALDNPDLIQKMRQAGRAAALAQYSIGRVTAQYIALYESLGTN